MELCQWTDRWGIGKGSAPEGGGHGTVCPWGSGHSHELPEQRKHLDTALRRRVWIWDGAVWSQGLASVIPVVLCHSALFQQKMP